MKIIGVGISKTGTSSLAAALTELGFRCIHGWPPHAIDTADALADAPAACRFGELDVMYPGSKFILTVREREAWLESCRKHWARSRLAGAQPSVKFEYFWCRVHLFGRLDFDAENHWQSYVRHVSAVREYFAGRPGDLLEIDITRGDGWEPLCRFLKVPVPNKPFPWKNKSPEGKSGVRVSGSKFQVASFKTGEAEPRGSAFPGGASEREEADDGRSGSRQVANLPHISRDRAARLKVFVLGVPHTRTTRAFNTCPFTTKAWNQCRMLHRRGHEVIHVGVEGSDPECSENVAAISHAEWSALYSHPGAKFYTTKTDGPYAEYQQLYARRVREAIEARLTRPWEAIVACTWGDAQIAATKALSQFVVESGIGYKHTWAKYRVFISYAWMHFHYGRVGKHAGNAWYDVVIPNCVDPELFGNGNGDAASGPARHAGPTKTDEFLFMGRLNDDKGIGIAIDVARRVGRRITIVGQGNPERFLKGNSHVRYVPAVDVEGRRKLMAEAAALFCPTQYIEPLGNVALEAQISGTPVICTDWGGFTETVLHGVTGYRCRTMEQFVWAAKNIDRIDPHACRQWVLQNFSPERVGAMYEEYFSMLLDLAGDGWYAERPGRDQLDWLAKWYPAANSSRLKNLDGGG